MALHVMEEANRCLGCKKPRCQEGCPIHTNIPEVIRLLKAGRLNDAGWMLFENNPLTTVCSLVCDHEHQCEGHCIRGIKDVPVHFSVIENFQDLMHLRFRCMFSIPLHQINQFPLREFHIFPFLTIPFLKLVHYCHRIAGL